MEKQKVESVFDSLKSKFQFLVDNPDQIDDELYKALKSAGDKVNEVKTAVQDRLK